MEDFAAKPRDFPAPAGHETRCSRAPLRSRNQSPESPGNWGVPLGGSLQIWYNKPQKKTERSFITIFYWVFTVLFCFTFWGSCYCAIYRFIYRVYRVELFCNHGELLVQCSMVTMAGTWTNVASQHTLKWYICTFKKNWCVYTLYTRIYIISYTNNMSYICKI